MNTSSVRSSAREIQFGRHHLFATRWEPADVAPNGPTIILFHDSLGCVVLWREFPQALAQATGLPVVAYDRLGFGQSDENPEAPGRGFVADEACAGFAALREGLDIDRFIGLGHSVGGGMAVAAAAAFPEACDAVITEAAQAFVEDRTLAGIREAKTQFAAPDQIGRLSRYHGDKADWVLDAWIETWLSPDFADWSLDAQLKRVRCPMLAIHGDRDEYGSVAHVRRMGENVGGFFTPVLLEDCGHVPHREVPDRVIRAVTDFLAGEGRRAPGLDAVVRGGA